MNFFQKYFIRGETYAKKHPIFHATIHSLGGIAVGILITHPFADPHPLKWAAVFGGLSILGHLYASMTK